MLSRDKITTTKLIISKPQLVAIFIVAAIVIILNLIFLF